MPKHHPKTRFSIKVRGRLREVFSVRERAANQLVILMPKSLNMMNEEGNHRLIEDHISVHSSPSSSGTLIKRTVTVGEGDEHDTTQFILHAASGWARPVIARASLNLDLDAYALPERRRDAVHHLGGFNPDRATLVFCIIVARKPWDVSQLEHPTFQVKFAEFENFFVGVAFAFQMVPSFDHGQDYMCMTSKPRKNREPVLQLRIGESDWGAERVIASTRNMMLAAAQLNVENYQKRVLEAGRDRIVELDQLANKFVVTLEDFEELNGEF